MSLVSPNAASTLIPMREFCGFNRVSVNAPPCVFAYGMLPKFVPIPDPGFVDLVTAVISINPTGVKYASPSLNCKGDSLDVDVCPAAAVVVAGSALKVGGA